jgi:hypothetical protein
MAQQVIGIGAAPDDGTGDPLRTGGQKINANFTELYEATLTSPAANAAMQEAVRDWVAAFVSSTNANLIILHDDTANTLTFTVPGSTSSVTVPVDFKDSVDLATTANITLSGEQTIDGTMTSTSRVLVKNQTVGSQNGVYVTAAGAWARAADADASSEVTSGLLIYVESGGTNGNQVFMLTTPDPITLDTTSLNFQAIVLPASVFVRKTVSGTTYTHILSDATKKLALTNAGIKTVTIAPQSSVNSAVNTTIKIINEGAGLATVAPGSGVQINSLGGVLTIPQGHEVQLQKRANPNTWDLTGIPMSAAVASLLDDASTSAMRTTLGLGTIATFDETTAAQFQANTLGKALSTDKVWSAAAEVTLTDAATIAVDMATFINATVTLGGNRTLGQPSNTKVGQSGVIRIVQDGTGSRTLAYHADWKFAGGADPVLSTAAGSEDLLFYQVLGANKIFANLIKAIA